MFIRLSLCALLFTCCLGKLAAQQAVGDNLVPNPGFERFAATPIGWFYKGEHFTRVMRDWSAATAASPDVFGPKVRVPSSWAEKDFGKQAPRAGGAMAGLTLYGCAEGKPHCREYVQVRLTEELVPGQTYEVSAYVAHLPRSLEINNLGFLFANYSFDEPTDVLLKEQPQVEITTPMRVRQQQWIQVKDRFVADAPATYLIIGNFKTDEATEVSRPAGSNSLKYAYYYLDEVVVRKVPPIVSGPAPVASSDAVGTTSWKVGSVVRLRNVFFDFDKSELLPRSFVELDKLVRVMRTYPDMTVELSGHTDSRGDDAYNLRLSLRRAQAVADYLQLQGIAGSRLQARGAGSREPVADNTTDEGRDLNRRVELKVISMEGFGTN